MLFKQTFIESNIYSTEPGHILYSVQEISFFVCFLIEFVNNATQFFLSFSKKKSAVSEDLQINSFWKTSTLYKPINSTIPVH